MRPQETDINTERLVFFDEIDAMFLSQDKDLYEGLNNLSLEEKVFDGEQSKS